MTTPYPTPLPEAPFSVNFRVSEAPDSPQFTIRAANATELEHLAADAALHGAAISRYLVEFRAGLLAGYGMASAAPQAPSQAPSAPASQYQPPAQQYGAPAPVQAAPAAPQTGGNGAAPQCPHGTKVYRQGVNKNGKPYKMWACPSQDRGHQCPPEWL